ncbi:MAG: amidohydrolase family protein [Planctomycetes bacterium]|nr:amidohydrolase family protein [Planctomycetota bacterium]
MTCWFACRAAENDPRTPVSHARNGQYREAGPQARHVRGLFRLLLPILMLVATGAFANEPQKLAFRVGKVVTMDAQDRVINNGVVLIADGKIQQIGPAGEVAIPDGYQVIDRPDHWLLPGIVEAHNHAAGAMRDLHDYVYLTNPGLRTLEALEPESENNKRSRAAGITAALNIPGSGNNMSGFGTITKLAGESVDDMLIRSPGCLKLSQAGNPERYWYGVSRTFMYYNLRQTMEKALAYHQAWERFEKGETQEKPAFDLFWDDFRPVFRREMISLVHTQMYQVVMTTVDMLAKKLKIRVLLGHSTFDAYKTVPMVVEQGDIHATTGPRQLYFDRQQGRIMGIASRWWHGGLRTLGINTDSPVIPQEELTYQAAMACYYGWKPYEALRGITRISAESLMIEHRVGSIENGKDADLGLWTGDPIDPRSACELTVINGRIVYDAQEKREF